MIFKYVKKRSEKIEMNYVTSVVISPSNLGIAYGEYEIL
jgi:hypothetical protein